MNATAWRVIGLSITFLAGAYLGYLAINQFIWVPVRNANISEIVEQKLAVAELLLPIAKGEIDTNELNEYISGYVALVAFFVDANIKGANQSQASYMRGFLQQVERHQEALGIAHGRKNGSNFVDERLRARFEARVIPDARSASGNPLTSTKIQSKTQWVPDSG